MIKDFIVVQSAVLLPILGHASLQHLECYIGSIVYRVLDTKSLGNLSEHVNGQWADAAECFADLGVDALRNSRQHMLDFNTVFIPVGTVSHRERNYLVVPLSPHKLQPDLLGWLEEAEDDNKLNSIYKVKLLSSRLFFISYYDKMGSTCSDNRTIEQMEIEKFLYTLKDAPDVAQKYRGNADSVKLF